MVDHQRPLFGQRGEDTRLVRDTDVEDPLAPAAALGVYGDDPVVDLHPMGERCYQLGLALLTGVQLVVGNGVDQVTGGQCELRPVAGAQHDEVALFLGVAVQEEEHRTVDDAAAAVHRR